MTGRDGAESNASWRTRSTPTRAGNRAAGRARRRASCCYLDRLRVSGVARRPMEARCGVRRVEATAPRSVYGLDQARRRRRLLAASPRQTWSCAPQAVRRRRGELVETIAALAGERDAVAGRHTTRVGSPHGPGTRLRRSSGCVNARITGLCTHRPARFLERLCQGDLSPGRGRV